MEENDVVEFFRQNIYFVVLALLVAFGALETAGAVLNTENPVVSVVSCSMYPALNVGDILFVYGSSFDSIEEDDIVVYDVWSEIEFTVDGESFHLKEDQDEAEPFVETVVGEIRLLEANSRQNPSVARIEIEGETHIVSPGDTLNIDGSTVQINGIEGMDIPIVHRVINKEEDYLETKGDNNREQLSFERDVRPEQIHGTSLFQIPRIGGLKLLASDFLGIEGEHIFRIDSYPICSREV